MMAYYYGYDLPPPLVDHIHERTHQHRTLLESLVGHHSRPERHPNQPDVDLRETPDEYLIEVEVPGIKNAADVQVHFTTNKHVSVTGSVDRPDGADATSNSEGQVPSPSLLVGERRLGLFRRDFHFPMEVDMDKLVVKLEAGLLRIRAPKLNPVHPTPAKVHD